MKRIENHIGGIVEYRDDKVIRNERVIPTDIDDTIVMHTWTPDQLKDTVDIPDAITGGFIRVLPNQAMIRLVKEEKARGAYVMAWSRGGYQWAADVILAVGLYDYVDIVLSKPLAYFDDKNVSEWMTDRVYIGPNTKYKSIVSIE